MGVPRFMFYSHDGYGLGHFRRNLVIAQAIAVLEPSASVLLACSAEGVDTFALGSGVDVLRLPGLRKIENGRYVSRRLHLDDADVISLRSAVLASAVADFRPHVLLADKHPLGIGDELLPALELLRETGGRAALGLRDVLDDPDRTRAEWTPSLGRRAAEFHQLVLAYGSPNLLSPLDDGLLPPELVSLGTHCGYVVGSIATGPRPEEMPPDGPQPLVLATAGGGEDGLDVLRAFVGASRGADWRAVLVGGPQMEWSDWLDLEAAAASARVTPMRRVRDMLRWYPYAAALVCMGGYNTLLEAVASGIPTVCVPRTRPRREQLIRARAFADMGLIQVVEPESLNATTLARAIGSALATPRSALAARARGVLDLDGAQRAAALLVGLARAADPQLREPLLAGAP